MVIYLYDTQKGAKKMSERLVIINDLSNVRLNYEKKFNISCYLVKSIKFSIAFLLLRIIFTIPVFILSNGSESFLDIYCHKYALFSLSYEEVWKSFKYAFSIVFQNNGYLIKYIIASFIFLSIILIVLAKSPIGILISFIITIISPYIINNIFLPAISLIYVPLNFLCYLVDSVIPPSIPVLLIWAAMGAVLGIVRAKKILLRLEVK